MSFKKLVISLGLFITHQIAYSQYILNGNATQDACNEYTLTQAVNWLGGSVWNANKIDLDQSFDFNFDVFLGSNDGGADGIAFVLQPVSTSVGTSGGGLGYSGITPAVGVTIDTWQNSEDNDPAFDHIAIQLNGNINHNTANNIAGPVSAVNGNNNIEDGAWHSFRISWNATTKTMVAYIDGAIRISVVKDFVNDVFSGDPLVYWGFTGSTGGANNLQKFKTALNPAFKFVANQKRCINEPITFYDSTISFTPITKLYWDFGDGSSIDSVNLNPVHTYTAAGDYTVVQKVRGADGCEAINTQIVQVGSKPVANFGFSNPLCNSLPVLFSDSSMAAVGIINKWSWNENGSTWSTLQNPEKIFVAGLHTIKLVATSNAGCISDTATKIFVIEPGPEVSFDFGDDCRASAVNFSATDNSATVTSWLWDFGDGGASMAEDTQYVYNVAGTYPVKLIATAANGCSRSLQKDINIYSTNAFAGNDTTVASGQPLQLSASGGINYEWSPSTGLSNPFIANPVALLTGMQTYTFVVRTYIPQGCESFDSINIKVYRAPEIYLPNAFTPNGDSRNDLYHALPIGIKELRYLRIFNRYGQQIFYARDFSKGWDGTWNGRKQTAGVYVVMVNGIDFSGQVIERKSTFLLIR